MRTERFKVALVTGGSRGIGKAIVERLASDGFAVILNYNKSGKSATETAQKLQKKGYICLPVKADITKEREVDKMIKETAARFKTIDILINNAGTDEVHSLFLKGIRKTDYDKMMDVNLKGPITVTQAALPFLKKRSGSKIIFMSSSTVFTGICRKPVYVISKAGLVGLVRTLANELAPRILVNGIAPGYIQTQMTNYPPAKIKKIIKKTPLGRFGKPEEVAALVSFLVSSENTFITGQVIHINGGLFLA